MLIVSSGVVPGVRKPPLLTRRRGFLILGKKVVALNLDSWIIHAPNGLLREAE